ncbi:hypothetical protein Pcinc_032670 [Petrolisthes cinctipes]|uniref:Regulatory protein zeste n=1 Tax=Petrolisthes cinctipes TaxID=88211 RepID=A0AAE1K0D7_PETCI|nr:hypothetical protein Pcinc_032670 [Petrolisthes cinctipes]
MAGNIDRRTQRAAPVSTGDKEVLVDIMKMYMDIINDKSTKFCAVSKKAMVWQEIARKFSDSTGHQKTSQQVRKIWENIRNRTKKDYTRNKAERRKTGGGPQPKPVDSVSAAVLPSLEEELEPLGNTWEKDGTVILSLTEVEVNDPEERRTSTPVPDGDPVTTGEEPSTSKQNRPCLNKKKLASREKQEALKLASERNYLLREMDPALQIVAMFVSKFDRMGMERQRNLRFQTPNALSIGLQQKTGGDTSDTKTFTHIEEAMAQVIEEVQVSGISVDSKTQAVMWMTQDCHQGPLHLDLGQVGRTSGQLQWKTVKF